MHLPAVLTMIPVCFFLSVYPNINLSPVCTQTNEIHLHKGSLPLELMTVATAQESRLEHQLEDLLQYQEDQSIFATEEGGVKSDLLIL